MTDSEKTATAQTLLDDLIRFWVEQRRFHRKQRDFLESPRFSELVGDYNLDVLFAIRHALKIERVQR